MADIELVVKVDEQLVEWIDEYSNIIRGFNGKKIGIIVDAIKNGTPLPKGHGRLIDADEINSRISREYCGYMLSESSAPIKFCIMIDEAPTIIEADGGEE